MPFLAYLDNFPCQKKIVLFPEELVMIVKMHEMGLDFFPLSGTGWKMMKGEE